MPAAADSELAVERSSDPHEREQAENDWRPCTSNRDSEASNGRQKYASNEASPKDRRASMYAGWADYEEAMREAVMPDCRAAPSLLLRRGSVSGEHAWDEAVRLEADVWSEALERRRRVVESEDIRQPPASAGAMRALPPTAGEKYGGSASASARARRATSTNAPAQPSAQRAVSGPTPAAPGPSAPSSATTAATAGASAAQEPFSPTRPGAAMRRSRSMPAPRKSADDNVLKPKMARSSFAARRTAESKNSCSMPKSTAAAAAGAGAVAAKKRAKSGKKLMLPFAYAEDDPRVGHVESADGRIAPEYLPS